MIGDCAREPVFGGGGKMGCDAGLSVGMVVKGLAGRLLCVGTAKVAGL